MNGLFSIDREIASLCVTCISADVVEIMGSLNYFPIGECLCWYNYCFHVYLGV